MNLKSVSLVICALIAIPILAEAKPSKEAMTQCMESIEIHEGTPDKAYMNLSPVRAKKNKGLIGLVSGKSAIDRAFEAVKKEACGKGADAIVNFRCTEAISGGGSYHADQNSGYGNSSVGTMPVCSGMAVKWK